MKTVLIVLNYNDYSTTNSFVNKISKYKSIDKIIIVDNFSTDNSYDELKKMEVDEKIDVIRTQANKGYASGNNYGMKYAEEKYSPKFIIISNPDVCFNENIIEKIEEKMLLDDRYAIGTCTMKEPKKDKNVGAGKLPKIGHIILRSMPIIGEIYNNKFLKYDSTYFDKEFSEVEFVAGSFFIAKANEMKKVNYLDEDTFLYCEEIILGAKLKKIGCCEIVLNNINYIHNHSITISKSISKNVDRQKIVLESRKVYAKKYLNLNKFQLKFIDLIGAITIKERYLIEYIKLMCKSLKSLNS